MQKLGEKWGRGDEVEEEEEEEGRQGPTTGGGSGKVDDKHGAI